MAFPVRGKVALVTGANRGIGKAIVEALLAAGASKVYAAVRDPGTAKGLVDASGGRVVAVALDLSKPDTITSAAKAAGDVQLVVNNAGVLKSAPLLSPEIWEALEFEFDVNVKGMLRVAQAFAPVLGANGGGALVQINSVVSLKNFPDFSTYCASKAASYSLTQALRETLAAQRTQVVSVHPGPIATDMADAAGLTEMAAPPAVVADALLSGLEQGDFHVFPDPMARQFWESYAGFAKAMVETSMHEGGR